MAEPLEPSYHSVDYVSDKAFGSPSQYNGILWTVDWILEFRQLGEEIPQGHRLQSNLSVSEVRLSKSGSQFQ
jgi:hypothetical protein